MSNYIPIFKKPMLLYTNNHDMIEIKLYYLLIMLGLKMNWWIF